MTERFIVVKRSQDLPRRRLRFPFSMPLPGSYSFENQEVLARGDNLGNVDVSVEEVSRVEVIDMARDPLIICGAPEIPTRLISPAENPQMDQDLPPENVSWGIQNIVSLDSPFDGRGVKIGILDTGIDECHSAFLNKSLEQEDFTGEGTGDLNGHGTHIAGVAFGQSVNGNRIGVAPGVTDVYIGKVLDRLMQGKTSFLALAIQQATKAGCQVICLSLGVDFSATLRNVEENYDYSSEESLEVALYHYRATIRLFEILGALAVNEANPGGGSLLVAAAGNGSRHESAPPVQIPSLPPAETEGFLSVGAIGRSAPPENGLAAAPFSNIFCDICAPGVMVYSAEAASTDSILPLSGTSVAVPHVAGVAALWIQHFHVSYPAFHAAFTRRIPVRQMLIENASTDRFSSSFHPYRIGSGLVQGPP